MCHADPRNAQRLRGGRRAVSSQLEPPVAARERRGRGKRIKARRRTRAQEPSGHRSCRKAQATADGARAAVLLHDAAVGWMTSRCGLTRRLLRPIISTQGGGFRKRAAMSRRRPAAASRSGSFRRPAEGANRARKRGARPALVAASAGGPSACCGLSWSNGIKLMASRRGGRRGGGEARCWLRRRRERRPAVPESVSLGPRGARSQEPHWAPCTQVYTCSTWVCCICACHTSIGPLEVLQPHRIASARLRAEPQGAWCRAAAPATAGSHAPARLLPALARRRVAGVVYKSVGFSAGLAGAGRGG
jgi:hypothetical protein